MKKNLVYLSESYIFNVFQDMDLVKSLARERNIATPPMLIFNFDVPRYAEAAEFAELCHCPATVANVFMDYSVRNFPFNIQKLILPFNLLCHICNTDGPKKHGTKNI